ncbi:FecR family protein [Sphingobacterium psychroaquaticum]|uniref:FecR family protein n=1 Tax=Sphingobacterium psychroaquaticum TaxID=561061 RepID=UPI00106BA0B2|nr:FecR family protein [Sphingobacterium psychroaquaticum]QBQ40489.1 FecR family protein [Sphingobacterium psychroaquaticum]
MKDVNKFDRVLKRYLANQYNTEDVLFLQQYFLEGDASIVADRVSKILDQECVGLQEADNMIAAERVVRKLDQYIAGFTYVPENKFHLRPWLKVATIALVSFALGLTAYLFLFRPIGGGDFLALEEKADILSIDEAIDVVAPETHAYMRIVGGEVLHTFGQGEEVFFDANGNLLANKQNSLPIKQGVEVEFVAPRGALLKMKLPDGSAVTLNAESRLVYNTNFSAGNRSVLLEGEAFFEVSKRRRAGAGELEKFTVVTDKQLVEVHGTRFNVKAYRGEKNTKTALLEGLVDVVTPTGRYPLQPGKQSANNGRRISVASFDDGDVLGWTNNDFVFSNHSLEEVMQQIQRWYNIEYSFSNDECKTIKIGGSVSRNQDLYTVLKALAATGAVQLSYKDRFVKIYAK